MLCPQNGSRRRRKINSSRRKNKKPKHHWPAIHRIHRAANILVSKITQASILGRDFLQHFGTSFSEVNSVRTERSLSLDAILEKHSIVFDTVMGKFKHKQVRLSISDNVRPIFCKQRQVPHAFKAQVESELERLERLGVITPTETSD